MTQAVSKSQPRWSSHLWLSLKLAIETGCVQYLSSWQALIQVSQALCSPWSWTPPSEVPINSFLVHTGSSRQIALKLAESQKDDPETAAIAFSIHSTEPCWWHWMCSLQVAPEVTISLCPLMQMVGASQHKLRNIKFGIIKLHWLSICRASWWGALPIRKCNELLHSANQMQLVFFQGYNLVPAVRINPPDKY